MIDNQSLKKLLQSYNFNSNVYGPRIYNNNNEIGIVIDIKDSLWGYLTRVVCFNDIEEAEDFLKKYKFWLDNNNLEIKISLDNYETFKAKVLFTYQNKELTLNDMFNFEDFKKKYLEVSNLNSKDILWANVKELTNYLINLKKLKYETTLQKNKLKRQENDLKFALIEYLAVYYGKNGSYPKKEITNNKLEEFDTSLFVEKMKKVKNKTEEEIQNYLKYLINILRKEEMEDKYLINLYSNNIYEYNIDILKKQIDFVKKKIKAEKNFSVKGSKLHNIDAELKSFLDNQEKPLKLENFMVMMQNKVKDKYDKIKDYKEAYQIISGNKLELKNEKEMDVETQEMGKVFFDNLTLDLKANLVLYNSVYKDIINFIIQEKPNKREIKKKFDLNFYYKDMEEIVYSPKNIKYSKYFNIINFSCENDFLNSLGDISKVLEELYVNGPRDMKAFLVNDSNEFKELTLKPIYDLKKKAIVDIKANIPFIYVPFKLQLDYENKIISEVETQTIYYKGELKDLAKNLKVNFYEWENNKNSDIIVTDLKLKKEVTFEVLETMGDIND